jgi:uncharacterized membrane protein YsdA (DUF1294 family)
MDILSTLAGQIAAGSYLAINLMAFIVMARDKRLARRGYNAERAPEGFMFFLAAVGGSLGVYLGMLAFRHKTRKWYFQLGVSVLLVQNFAILYVGWLFLM